MIRVARVLLTALLLAGLPTAQLLTPTAAMADVSTLCRGYTGCGQQGMSDAGYGRASGSMYWRMYAGHNCTNYVAFRMIQNGMPNVRPWVGGGNATYWGTSMPEITDDVPTVGSVAWWRAGVYPAGSAGHVAYVEKVISPNEIIVSQDSWGGDFSWARITRTSRGWPSGFIHFNDATLTNTSRPTVEGRPRVGSTLTATPGTWTPAEDVAYKWRAGGANIRGANGPAFVVGEEQLGQRLRVRVTATRPGYPTTTARSLRTTRVAPGTLESTRAPAVTGEPVVDQTLTADTGAWHPAPDAVTVQWLADGQPIEGAVTEQLVVGPALVGRQLAVRVTGSRSGFADVSVTSPATAPVKEAVFVATTEPVVSGVPRLGETLVVDAGVSTPAGEPLVQWLRDGQPVDGASGTSYVLGDDDLGTRISARVRWDRPGYVSSEATSATSPVVKATPTLEVQLSPQTQRLQVRADVLVPEGASLPESVRVRIGRVRESVPLVGGTATTVLAGLRPATRTVRVVVPGGPTTERVVVVEEVVIP